MDPTTQFWITVGASFFGGGLVVFLLGQIIDYVRREKRWLGYDLSSRCIIQRDDPELEIFYKKNPVQRAVLHSIRFKNIGNRPLKETPIILHPPSGLGGYKAAATSTNLVNCEYFAAPRGLGVKFDLLNPGEEVSVAFTGFDCPDEKLQIAARQEGVVTKDISGRSRNERLFEIVFDTATSPTHAALNFLRFLVLRQ